MFRFTIRDVLWLMVVVGVCCAWWVHVKSVEERNNRRMYELDQRHINEAATNKFMAEFFNRGKQPSGLTPSPTTSTSPQTPK